MAILPPPPPLPQTQTQTLRFRRVGGTPYPSESKGLGLGLGEGGRGRQNRQNALRDRFSLRCGTKLPTSLVPPTAAAGPLPQTSGGQTDRSHLRTSACKIYLGFRKAKRITERTKMQPDMPHKHNIAPPRLFRVHVLRLHLGPSVLGQDQDPARQATQAQHCSSFSEWIFCVSTWVRPW